MVVQNSDYRMTRSDEMKVTALEVPYKGLNTSLVILLPEEVDGIEFLAKNVTADNLVTLIHSFRIRRDVELRLPKLRLEQFITLNDTLKRIGVKDLFSTDCDLSGICENGKLLVTEVIHKAYIEINEKGTEVAAVTAEVVEECSLISHKKRFLVDHPFMFLIMCNDP
nr:serpin B4-like [Dermacentor andersoni]